MKMIDALDLLKTRRSIPAGFLAEPGPDAATLRDILAIATRVPDHGKLAPWRFILLDGDSRAAASAALAALRASKEPATPPEIIAQERIRFTRAPLVIAIVSRVTPGHPKAPEWEQVLSAGAVGMNLLNAVQASGFSAVWLTEWPAYDAGARRLLGLADPERIAGFVYVGTATVPPQERPRPVVDDLVSRWTPPAA